MTNHNYASRVQNHNSSIIADLLVQSSDPQNISFAGGYPDASLFPSADLADAFQHAVADNTPAVFQYTDAKGPQELRELVAARHAKHMGYPATTDDIIMTQGGQQALDLLASLFLDAGDGLAIEGPTYLGAISIFENYAPKYYEIPIETDGINLAILEQQLQANRGADRIKLLYLVPDFQNPTGITISVAKRQRLAELAETYDFYIIEDAPYRELRYRGEHLPTLQSFDTHHRVIYVSSFSKILAPSLRIGYICASPTILTAVAGLKSAADIQSPNMTLDALTYYLNHYDIDAHIANMIPYYAKKRQTMIDALHKYMPSEVTFTEPEGGFFLWITAPASLDLNAFMYDVLIPKARIVYIPSQAQYIHGDVANSARLNFSAVAIEKIEPGIRLLAETFTNYLTNHPAE